MIKESLRKLIAWASPPAPPKKAEPEKRTLGNQISFTALASMGGQDEDVDTARSRTFTRAKPYKGVVPVGSEQVMAMDAAMDEILGFASEEGSIFAEGLSFMGYPYLSELTQRAEYRRPSEIIAKDMTRKWIKLTASGDAGEDQDKTEKLKIIESELKRLNVQSMFKKAIEHDGFFGRAQLFIDTGDNDDPNELKMPLVDSTAKIRKNGIKRLQLIEPIWTYPSRYDSSDPLDKDFFKPSSWFVMGKEIHSSRFLTFVTRPVPDLLKPVYSFGGLSLSQMAKPYVDNWLRTRQSVSDLIHAFTVFVLSTNMGDILTGGGADMVIRRAEMFNRTRDNRGILMINKETEEFENVTAPLGSLDKLQAQSQEHMAAVVGIPLVILLGISPTGLSASTDGEIRTYYQWIESLQNSDAFRPHLYRVICMIQLAKWGEVDPGIDFEFNPLWALNESDAATKRKTDAETGQILINGGVIDPTEERQRVAEEESTLYPGLDLTKVITPPEQGNPEGGIGDGLGLEKGDGTGGKSDGGMQPGGAPKPPGAQDAALGWQGEPRKPGGPGGGEWTSGGGGGSRQQGSNPEHRAQLGQMMQRISEPDGGFTYQPETDEEPKSGYALSIYPDRSYATSADQLKLKDLAKYVRKNRDLLAKHDHYVGAWHDPASHKVFLDISMVTDDEKKAAELAKQHDQIAYFDLGNMKSVTVNPEATSGGVVH